jgi:hypothetical protein
MPPASWPYEGSAETQNRAYYFSIGLYSESATSDIFSERNEVSFTITLSRAGTVGSLNHKDSIEEKAEILL